MNINKKRDGHVHSPFCPHGCDDKLEKYIEKALEEGLTEITFAEHMPLPLDKDPSPRNNSALKIEDVEPYLNAIKEVKEIYKDKIKINIGLEVDYLEGKEKEIKMLLDKYGPMLDDSILSVHVLKFNNKYYPIGAGAEPLNDLMKEVGGMDKVYDLYFQTMLKSIQCDLGAFKPKRIGHPNLVRKYKKDFPNEIYNIDLLEEIAIAMKKNNYEIDLNTSGIRKEKCKEIYPSGILLELFFKHNVSMILGSDAHSAKEVALFFKDIEKYI